MLSSLGFGVKETMLSSLGFWVKETMLSSLGFGVKETMLSDQKSWAVQPCRTHDHHPCVKTLILIL